MKLTVYDHETNRWITVDQADAEAGIASGRYEAKNQLVRTDTGTAVRAPSEMDTAAAVGDRGARDIAAQQYQAELMEARREAFDTLGDKALTFGEGVVDALSLGLIHGHGEQADIRRDVNAGSALLGQLVGTAAGLGFTSPVSVVAKGSANLGKAAARGVLGEAASARAAGTVATRAAEEAAIGAGLMGSTAFGHQLSDAIIEDKAFAGEAIVHEAGLGALLGFGAGALAGGFKVAASRNAIKAQGGLLDGASYSSRSLVDEIKGVHGAWRDAAGQYEARAGVLEVLHSKGVIPEEMVVPYRDAAKKARRAVDILNEYSPMRALDAGPKEYQHFRRAMEQARAAVDEAGAVFASPPSAARPQRMPLGQAKFDPVRTGHVTQGGEWAQHLDELMLRDPEALAAYERLHGRPYEPMGGRGPIQGEGGIPGERFVDDAAAPTDKTAPGRRQVKEAAPEQVVAAGPGSVNRIDGGVTGAFERGELRTNVRQRPATGDSAYDAVPKSGEFTQVTPEGVPTRAVDNLDTAVSGAPEGMPWRPSAPTGRFRLSDFSEDTLAGEGVGFRELNRQTNRGDWLQHGERDLGLHPDGYMSPAKDIRANAEAFAQFRERAASETALERAASPAPARPVESPKTVQDWNAAKGDGNRTVKSGKPDMEAPPSDKTVRDAGVPKGEVDALGDRTYRDPNVPKGEPLPKVRLAEDGKTAVFEPADEVTQIRRGSPEWDEFQRRAAENYIEKWYWESKAQGPRVNPADEAAVRLDAAMRKLSEISGGRLDSAGALELGEYLGLKPTNDMFVDRLDQLWALRKAAKFAADEARGVATPLRQSGNGMVDEMARRYMAKMGAAMAGGFLGGPLGGAVGWVAGKHLAGAIGFGAKAAASAGKVMEMAVKTGESLLRGRRATVAARAVAGNRAYAYDDEGPIQDPVKRIQKIQRLAANPDQIRATVRNQLGDVSLQAPQMAQAIEDTAVRHVTNLSLQAPVVMMDVLGRTVMPPAGALRKFFEYENSTHDLPGLLGSIERGAFTPTQAMALAQQHVAVHGQIVKTLLADPDVLARKTTAQLRAMEMVLQIPLTPASTDPGYVARVQQAWAAGGQAQPQQQAPQAFKITAPAPTPTQAHVAPGNE